MLQCILLFLLFTSLNAQGDTIDVPQLLNHVQEEIDTLDVGSFQICDWKTLQMAGLMKGIKVTSDGEDYSFDAEFGDVVVEGYICGESGTSAILWFMTDGLQGSIHTSSAEYDINIVDTDTSTIDEVEAWLVEDFEESDKVKAEKKDFQEHLKSSRRNLDTIQPLYPGSVDINLHIEVDYALVDACGSRFRASNYVVELISLVSEDVFYELGFQLNVVSMNIRTSLYDCAAQREYSCTAEIYLDEAHKVAIPEGAHLVYVASNFADGGITWNAGAYFPHYAYGVFGSLRPLKFSIWDRKVVAHELAHSLGAVHTHEMNPKLDTCGVDPPNSCKGDDRDVSTVMSYCHHCPGKYDNVKMEFSQENKDLMLTAYHTYGHLLAPTLETCGSLPNLPTTGLPFYLKDSEECLQVDTSACDDCGATCMEAGWQYDTHRKQIHSTEGRFWYCWEAAEDCSGISIQRCTNQDLLTIVCPIHYNVCKTEPSQKFIITDQGVENEICGLVKFSGNTMGFEGTPVKDWCRVGHMDVDDAMYSCDHEVTTLTCGETVTGWTSAYCPVKEFKFVPTGPYGASVDMTTCGSNFDTDVTVELGTTNLYYNDFVKKSAEAKCKDYHAAELYDMKLDAGEEYTILLDGWCDSHGAYEIKVICREYLTESQTTVNFPTISPVTPMPTPQPVTSEPTLSPTTSPTDEPTSSPTTTTSEPTRDPTNNPTSAGYVCEDENAYCAYYTSWCDFSGGYFKEICAKTCGACLDSQTMTLDTSDLDTQKASQSIAFSPFNPMDILAFIGLFVAIAAPCYHCYNKSSIYARIDENEEV